MSLESKIDRLNSNIENNNDKLDRLIELQEKILQQNVTASIDAPKQEKSAENNEQTDNKAEDNQSQDEAVIEEGPEVNTSGGSTEQDNQNPVEQKSSENREVTYDDLTELATQLMQQGLKDQARSILGEYNATKIPHLPEDKYGEVYNRLSELLNSK